MFDACYVGNLDIYRLNFARITLISREGYARKMKKIMHISLINCCFKIITKDVTNIYAQIIDKLIDFCQYAFIRGRFILVSVVIAHEVIHEIHNTKIGSGL
jgi:hypothetical protein